MRTLLVGVHVVKFYLHFFNPQEPDDPVFVPVSVEDQVDNKEMIPDDIAEGPSTDEEEADTADQTTLGAEQLNISAAGDATAR